MQRTLLKLLREQNLVAPGDRVLAAVSGGADSVALLHLLRTLVPDYPFTLHAAHLDHAIRPESRQDAEFVRSLCDRLDVPLTVERIDVPALARERRRGLEETGRQERREFLRAAAERLGCARIALGHHRGDQAETVLHRLLRGSAAPGLAGMRPASGPFIRPLLSFGREELRAYLAAHGLPHIEDASKADLAFTRNRLRHELIPRLEGYNPRIEEHLARLGRRLAVEEDYWEREERQALDMLSRPAEDGLRLDRSGLYALHPALQLRVLRRALAGLRGDLYSLAAVHLEALAELLGGERPQAELHLPGAWAGLRYGELWLRREAPTAPPPFALSVPGAGTYPLPGGGRLSVCLEDAPAGETPRMVEFAAADVAFPLTVRSLAPGDRFRPVGGAGRRKIKDFLIDLKVEREQRRRLLLVEADEVLWLVGVRRCAGRRPVAGAPVLRLAVIPPAGGE